MASTISSSLYTTPSYLPFSLNQAPSPSLSPSASNSQKTPPPGAAAAGAVRGDERLRQVHSIAEFEEALRSAKNRLVVVEYAASHSANSQRMYPFVVELSRACGDVDFLLVMGDESEQTRALCRREGIDRVPHFAFYKGMEKVHDEEGIGPDQLAGDVLYYGDSHSASCSCTRGRRRPPHRRPPRPCRQAPRARRRPQALRPLRQGISDGGKAI
uniref:Thioredoxin domain-containing protein n=1 Tax=Ananas comosus var. bracteatus TaxID=296719 RepID=A0A6V7NJI7_ANACO|nr:unnamed protein product [Ananas comosus var. bracteatus]